ncbi:unnamed protein product [Didymodactylos carnosus]|uniref:Uncharacterized protein n=2 Tax=Didymodactylos carnosus TaxID=1234261 RepID=A0A8S2FDW7_9BILA|nr:unnamed protein product [Didymodactylos carnosus]CAF4234620.1 unnamed protein product [Didymodactylos carnosus]
MYERTKSEPDTWGGSLVIPDLFLTFVISDEVDDFRANVRKIRALCVYTDKKSDLAILVTQKRFTHGMQSVNFQPILPPLRTKVFIYGFGSLHANNLPTPAIAETIISRETSCPPPDRIRTARIAERFFVMQRASDYGYSGGPVID